jgi:hypothetical protein
MWVAISSNKSLSVMTRTPSLFFSCLTGCSGGMTKRYYMNGKSRGRGLGINPIKNKINIKGFSGTASNYIKTETIVSP